MKEGLIFENNELVYYKNDQPYHAGVIEVDGAIYYISSNGRAVRGRHNVHRTMSNDILKRGTYIFGDDYKLIKGSYIAPKKKKSKRNRKVSWKHFFKQNKRAVILGEIVLLLIIVMGLYLEHNKMKTIAEQSEKDAVVSEAFTLPEFEEDVLLCSKAAKKEFDGQALLKDVVNTGDPYRSFRFEYQFPETLDIEGILLLSEDEDLKQAREYKLIGDTNYVSVDNLKTGTEYYYKVIIDDQEYTGSFRTAQSTRFVSIPNLANTRDIGGYINQEGKTVKQGMLIRGVELDGFVNAQYFISDTELESVQETFGFVYDFDLRNPIIYSAEYSSRLGVPHRFYNAPMYGEIFNATYKESLRQIFSDLADPKKYPMYMHCTWGTDRTGTIIFLLQGILNMSEEDMVREYELTGYTNPTIVDNGKLDVVIYGLQSYEGKTVQEKIHTYLTKEIGVSEKEIESIRDIFLEK